MLDVMKALKDMMLAESTVTDLVSTRIYVNKIPKKVIAAQDTFQPNKILVIRISGGSNKADLLPVDNLNFNALCYGQNEFQADKVRRVVYQYFFTLSRVIVSGVLFHHVNSIGGPFPSIDPEIVWPAMAHSFTTLVEAMEVP